MWWQESRFQEVKVRWGEGGRPGGGGWMRGAGRPQGFFWLHKGALGWGWGALVDKNEWLIFFITRQGELGGRYRMGRWEVNIRVCVKGVTHT